MKYEVVDPRVDNYIKSIRDVGYSLEIAAADIIDNSITAKASQIRIYTVTEPELVFCFLDNGTGMNDSQLVEAMRLASVDPELERDKNDLGRFGLGLKLASFSQCKKLTVISKIGNNIVAKQWDLNFVIQNNKWLLLSPDEIDDFPQIDELKKQETGTLVVWQIMDRFTKINYSSHIDRLREHLSLVFHRFLEGSVNFRKLKIFINNNELEAFNPFNENHPATQEIAIEKVKLFNSTVQITPYILPHHTKLSQAEYERYETVEGYTKSQGFYLYRANRLLIYGTWWGLHRSIDAHKLVRIKIDIPNNQDNHWNIDIKKSIASPTEEIKDDLRRIIRQITEKGSRTYTKRGRKIEDKSTTKFWQIIPEDKDFRFALNYEHPVYEELILGLSSRQEVLLDIYLKGLQAYLPLEAIQAKLQQTPHQIRQEVALTDKDLNKLAELFKTAGIDVTVTEDFLKTELFKNRPELFKNDNK